MITQASRKNSNFSPDYTFDSYVIDSSNQAAYKAALNVAENPCKTHNPLLIYGGTGLGKSHLLHAIGQYASIDLSVRKLTLDEFILEFISFICKIDEFRKELEKYDVLIFEDVQVIRGKKQTQILFLDVCQRLQGMGKQIVITCDERPEKNSGLEAFIKAKPEGAMVRISSPEYRTRLAIAEKMVESEKTIRIPKEAYGRIALNLKSDIASIKGAVSTLVAHAKTSGGHISPEIADAVIHQYV